MRDAAADGRRWTADELAEALGLTYRHRTAMGITTIGAIDMNKAQREELRAVNSRKRSEAWRRGQGAKSRAEYEARSETRTEPWKELGMSKRTYQRRKQVGTSPNTPIEGVILVRSHLRHGALAPSLVPALAPARAALRPPRTPMPISAAPPARLRSTGQISVVHF